MSGWDAYINALKGDQSVIQECAIYGQAAAPALWATSSQFVKAPEIAAISKGLTDKDTFDAQSGSGFIVNGEKYMKINSELNKVLRGKKGEYAVAAAFSKKTIVIGKGKASPQDVSLAVEKMAADLSGKGY